jgi:hypothetical protein
MWSLLRTHNLCFKRREAADYVPKLKGNVAAVLFKEIKKDDSTDPTDSNSTNSTPSSPGTAPTKKPTKRPTKKPTNKPTTRKLSSASGTERRLSRASRDLAGLGSLSSDDHPSRWLMETMRSLAFNEILDQNYDFAEEFCALPEDGSGCLVIKDLEMDIGKVSPRHSKCFLLNWRTIIDSVFYFVCS